MVKLEEFMKIFLLKEQGFSISAISRETGLDRKTVRKYLKRGKDQKPAMRKSSSRLSKLEPFKDRIHCFLTLNENEFIPATVIYKRIVQQGYEGSLSLVQKHIQQYKETYLPKVVVRFETLPGEQAQVDWGEKKIRDSKSGLVRKVYVFCMTLGWSRMRFVHFFPRADMYHFLLGHQLAFNYFGGVTREILYDQNRCVLTKPGIKEVEFNMKMMDFAHHYGFLPRVCRPYRAQTKGKVENLVKYVKQNFLSTQTTPDLVILNHEKKGWLVQINNKVHSTTQEIPAKRWNAEELSPLPRIGHYDLYYLETRKVFNDSTFSFKRRRYSVPPEYVGKFLSIKYRPEMSRVDVFYKDRPITQHRTDEESCGQYIIKRVHRHSIWKQWRYGNKILYRNAQKPKTENHCLSVYEEAAASDLVHTNSADISLMGREVNI